MISRLIYRAKLPTLFREIFVTIIQSFCIRNIFYPWPNL